MRHREHQLGPAASALTTGGEGLRDEVYSWPTVNPCRVDQETGCAGRVSGGELAEPHGPIQSELGEADSESQELRKRVQEAGLPEAIATVAELLQFVDD